MSNENQNIQDSGLPSRSMNCSADGHGKDAERFTPKQRADAIIQVLYADTPPPMQFELRDSIAAEIREAVEAEREACLGIIKDYNNLHPCDFIDKYQCDGVIPAIRNRK